METNRLRVNAIYPVIMGEGFFTGEPMLMVRLQGCSVRCPWCWKREAWEAGHGVGMSVPAILEELKSLCLSEAWVYITGGEPLEQEVGVTDLAMGIRSIGLKSYLETNGHHRFQPVFDAICITAIPGYDDELLHLADEVKFPVQVFEDIPSPSVKSLVAEHANIYLQPIDAMKDARRMCIGAAHLHGFRVSLGIQPYLYRGLT